MRSKLRCYPILLGGLILLSVISVTGCVRNPRYIYDNGVVEVGGDGKPIELVDNPNASKPTYAELIAFIKEDPTDEYEYTTDSGLEYVCSDFAEDVHNNAEKAGIRAAWVGIDFELDRKGHAINAFETTDRGLVYIDCTGEGFLGQLTGHTDKADEDISWDKVAYVEVGKEYGTIAIDEADSLSYSFYEEYEQKWEERKELFSDYNEEVTRYNQTVRGKIYREGSPELAEMEAWKARLKAKAKAISRLSEEIGDYWFVPLGIVQDIHIHWGRVK